MRLYDTDFAARSEQRAAPLRRHLAGERVNGLDWGNIVEEIEGAGRLQTKRVGSLLTLAMARRLKIAGWPTHPAIGRCWAEATSPLAQAQRRHRRSMAQHIDADERFADARREVFAPDPQHVPPEPPPEAARLSLAEPMDRRADRCAVRDGLITRAPRD